MQNQTAKLKKCFAVFIMVSSAGIIFFDFRPSPPLFTKLNQETLMTQSRFDRLNASLQDSDLDAVILNPGPTLTHLTGLRFHLMERPVVLMCAKDQDPAIVLPELELQKVASLPYRLQVFAYPENPAEWDSAFRKAAQALGLDGKRIGVEPRQLRLLEFRHVKAGAPEADYPDGSEVFASLRLRKDPDEIEAMRRAVRIAQDALEATLPLIKMGMTEKELSSELVVQLLRQGSEPEMPFAPIVSGGPNAANPHASPSDRRLQAGDLLVVDWGATYDGYISDLTRTFAVGEVEQEYHKIHKIVQEANAAGRAAGKPGAPCADVDKAARQVIENAGYGQYFTHRTGHGIGMEGHEEPYMRGDNMQLLEAGMAFTVEPGIYLPGRNGVRIEDNVVITQTGVDVLSDMPRAIRTVG
jgi:Xaa-Pro dipeptidase